MKKTTKRLLTLALAMFTLIALLSATSCDMLEDILDFDFLNSDEKQPGAEMSYEQKQFASSIGGVSETFEGAMSKKSYSSADEAALAYVENEIIGDAESFSISAVSSKTLRSSKIKKLDIPEEFLKNYDEVVEVEVEYNVERYSSSAYKTGYALTSSEKNDSVKTVKVYVIKYGSSWKYFIPCPITGDTINKTYYDSVFNAEKYKNCTFTTSSEAYIDVRSGGENVTMDMRLDQTVKYADGKIYLEQTTTLSGDGYNSVQTIYAYMETNSRGTVDCYVKTNENPTWVKSDVTAIGFDSIEELTPFYDQYLDYTYFTKTDYGFALAEENARRYFEAALMDSLSNLGVRVDLDEMDIEMLAEYYVSEGVLSGAKVDADVNMEVKDNGTTIYLDETVTATTRCTDYGTTVITRPNNLIEY